VPVYLAGAKVTGFFTFGPTIGASLNITMMSYDGTCDIGINIDTAAVPDPDVMVACLRESFAEIAALGQAAGRRRVSTGGRAARPERGSGLDKPDDVSQRHDVRGHLPGSHRLCQRRGGGAGSKKGCRT
jgi:hypothetical protein